MPGQRRPTAGEPAIRQASKVSPRNVLPLDVSLDCETNFMKSNIGISDRAIRLFIGLTILGLGIALNSPWGMIGVIPMITAALGFCPLYCPLKINTTENPNGH